MRDRRKLFNIIVALTVGILFAGSASAAFVGQLGILDTSGTNPATGNPWALGDPYHLVYITTTTTDALSTDIADYNAFVQSDATAAGMGGASWYAMGSTTAVDAIDNGVITGPVINVFDNGSVATDAADFWDLNFSSSTNPTALDGSGKNVHFGTTGGGTAAGGYELGAEGGSVRIEWSNWDNWNTAWRGESTADLKPLVATSEELQVIPEPASLALFILTGATGFMVRRRFRR